MSPSSSAPAEIRDAIGRSLLAFSFPGRLAIQESKVQRSAAFQRDWTEPLSSITQVRVRPRLQLFGRQIANVVEILSVASPVKWKMVFVGTETDAATIASALITAIKSHLASRLEHEAGSVTEAYNACHALFRHGAYIRASQLATWQSTVKDQTEQSYG